MPNEVKQVTPFTETVAINNSEPSRMFAPGWGIAPHGDDSLEEVIRRTKQGRKKTPIGAGTLKAK